MELPILSKLKEGERFDFATLADNLDQTREFWEWWWAEKAQDGVISRPEIIQDDDPVLTETLTKDTVNLYSYRDRFDRFLLDPIKRRLIPADDGSKRPPFREYLIKIVGANSIKLPGRPQIIFAGGGYGSGKTTILNMLTEAGRLPVGPGHHVGVDMFKRLIPEYSLIKSVHDGRASLTVQKECNQLAVQLFENLVDQRRSFIWDSSMSNEGDTTGRIRRARDAGYELTMIAVLTPYPAAVRQAMQRAKETHRFPHPVALPESHRGFRLAFRRYLPLFDEVTVFANFREGPDVPIVIAEQSGLGNSLVVHDPALLETALSLPGNNR